MKSPEERGPLAAWAYEARVKLNLSPESVVQELGRYNPATIRKAETLDRHMSRPLWRALTALYPHIAHEKGIAIPIPPGHMAGAGAGDTQLAPAAYLARLEDLVGLVGLLVKQNADLMAAVGLAPQTSEARAALEAWVESTASRLPLRDADPASTTAR